MRTTAIVCDLDGTLIDSHSGIKAAIRSACNEVLPAGVALEPEVVIGPPIRQILHRALPAADAQIIEKLARAYRRHYDSSGCLSYVPYPGVKDTLAQLAMRGIALFVLTNKPLVPTQRILADMGIDHLLSGVVCIDSRQPPFGSKCEAGLHLKASFKLAERSTILIGDSGDDWEVATASGFRFVAATYGYGRSWNFDETRYDCVATFAELFAIAGDEGGAE